MNSVSTVSALTNIANMTLRTHNVSFNSGIRRIFNCMNLSHTSDVKSKFRCFHTALEGARNTSLRSLLLGTVVVGGRQFQAQACKSVVYYVQKECKAFFRSSISEEKSHSLTGPLTKLQAHDLIMRLTGEERTALLNALQEFQSEKRKAEYEGQLAGRRWRSKFGRPSKLPSLGDVDPTGSYCPVPEDWLAMKYAESVPVPNTAELWRVVLHNAVPFVGFGFLDNFVMIIAGDQIELMLGSIMVLSTMAAAALGNTISDVMGIGSAWYVERLAIRIGMQPPKLSPIQLDMPSSRRAANMGRVMGVTLGCLLGMTPLLFLGHKKDKKDETQEEEPT